MGSKDRLSEFNTYNTQALREELSVLTVSDIARGRPGQYTRALWKLAGFVGSGWMLGMAALVVYFGIVLGASVVIENNPVVLGAVSLLIHAFWVLGVLVWVRREKVRQGEVRARLDRRIRVQSALLRSVLMMCPDGAKVCVPKPVDALDAPRLFLASERAAPSKHTLLGMDWAVTLPSNSAFPDVEVSLRVDRDDLWTVEVTSKGALPRDVWEVLSASRESGVCALYGAGKRLLKGDLGPHTKLHTVVVRLGSWSSWQEGAEDDGDVVRAALSSLGPVGEVLRVLGSQPVQSVPPGVVSSPVRASFEEVHRLNRRIEYRQKWTAWLSALCVCAFVYVLFGGEGLGSFSTEFFLMLGSLLTFGAAQYAVMLSVPEQRAYQSYSAPVVASGIHLETDAARAEAVVSKSAVHRIVSS